MDDGRKKALDLLEMAGDKIHKLLYRLTLRQDVAEDLMQDLFLHLACSRGFIWAEKPLAYAWRTAIHLAYDWRRRQKVMTVPLDHDVQMAHSQESPMIKLLQTEELDGMLAALACLKEPGREVLTRRYLLQEDYDVIAADLKKPAKQIRVICSRALEKLRGILTRNRQPQTKEDCHVA